MKRVIERLRRMSQTTKARLILLALVMTAALSPKQVEKLGDNFQIALPVIALGCSVVNGETGDFMLRYLSQWGVVQGSKYALGDAAINRRPNGNSHGMPSGHTATAVFAASNLVHQCITGNPVVKAGVILTAVFVGESRIYAKAHNIWQVLIGALVGWLGDRAFRRRSLARWWRRWRG